MIIFTYCPKFYSGVTEVMFAQSNSMLEVIGGVCDPVGSLLLGAFSRTVGREQGFESFRLSLHLQAGPLGGGLC